MAKIRPNRPKVIVDRTSSAVTVYATAPASGTGSGGTGGGGGAVDSVNGHTGVVVLTQDDIESGGFNKQFSLTYKNKLDGIAAGATVNSTDAALKNRLNHTGTQPATTITGLGSASLADTDDFAEVDHEHVSTDITDFNEAVDDAVATLLAGGTGVTVSYDDNGNTLTVTATDGGGSFDAENARDVIGSALAGVGNISVSVNDAADSITISTTATQNSSDAALRARSSHTGTQPATTITGLANVATSGDYDDLTNKPVSGGGGTATTAYYYPEDFGAVGDGNTDDTIAIQDAIDEAYGNGGGTVALSKGLYGWSGELQVKNAVTLMGNATRQGIAGSASPSVPGLVALSSDAQLKIGDRSTAPTPGGVRNLYVDGNDLGGDDSAVSQPGLIRIAGVDVVIRDLYVFRSAGDNIVHDATQNSVIVGGMSASAAGSALVLDNGAGALSFQGGYYGTSGGGTLTCRDTTGETNLYPYGPTNCTFTGTIFEAYGNLTEGPAEPFDHHAHVSGTDFVFTNCNFTAGAENDAACTILIDSETTGAIPTTATFISCLAWAREDTDAYRVVGPAVLSFVGQQSIADDGTHHAESFVCIDGGSPHISVQGEIILSGDNQGTKSYRTINSGSLSQVFTWTDAGEQFRLRSGQVVSVRREGDTGHRMYIDRDGTLGWFPGAAGAPVAYIQRGGSGAGSGLDYYTDAEGNHTFLGGPVKAKGGLYIGDSDTPFDPDDFTGGSGGTVGGTSVEVEDNVDGSTSLFIDSDGGGGSGGSSIDLVDNNNIARLDREDASSRAYTAGKAIIQYQDSTEITENWSDQSGVNAHDNGQVVGNKWYADTGATPGGFNKGVSIPDSSTWRLQALIYWKAGNGSAGVYFGVNCGTPDKDVINNDPDLIYVGVGYGGARTAVVGSNLTSVNSLNQGALGANPTTDCTFIATIEADEEDISLSLKKLGDIGNMIVWSFERSALIGLGKSINNVSGFLTDSRGTSGHAISPWVLQIDSIQTSRKKSLGGQQIEGNDMRVRRRSTGVASLYDAQIVGLPKNYDPRTPTPLVLWAHQSFSGSAWDPWEEAKVQPVTQALLDAGFIIAGVSDTLGIGDFGNQNALNEIKDVYNFLISAYNIGPYFFYGASMGGLTIANSVSQRDMPTPAAVAAVGGAYNQGFVWDLGTTFSGPLETAFGASGRADLLNKSEGYDPIRESGDKFRGVPWRFYTSDGDTLSPRAGQEEFSDKIAPYTPESEVVVGTGAHLDPSQYQAADLLAFYRRYLKGV